MVLELLSTEISVVMGMDHPNICKFYQVAYDNHYLNIVMELSRGITLTEAILKSPHISEKKSQVILRQIMHAIKYFH